jgi:apolipoprotein N-acyltransferase
MVDAVDKLHLVPFGEYIPFSSLLARVGLDSFVAGPMTFEPGSERHALTLPGGLKALPFICYEVIFPELVGEQAGDADLLINVTNDAWFGDTPGPYQHFRQAQLRAVETGLPVVRAANTGISGIIDPYGRVVDALAMNSRGVVDLDLAIPNSDTAGAPRLVGFGILAALALMAAAFRVQARRR